MADREHISYLGLAPSERQERRLEEKLRRSENDNVNEIDLFEVVFAIWDQKFKVLVSVMVCALIAGLYAFFVIKPVYQAEGEMYITNTDSIISMADLQLSSELAADYNEIMMSRTVLKMVVRELNLNMDYKALKGMVTVSNPESTHCLKVSTTSGDPNLAINITNTMMKVGIDQIYKIIGNDTPGIIDPAEADAVKVVSSSKSRIVGMGALIGLLLMCALIAMSVMLDMTVKTEEDVENYIGLPVLASVPDMEKKTLDTSDEDSKKARRAKRVKKGVNNG